MHKLYPRNHLNPQTLASMHRHLPLGAEYHVGKSAMPFSRNHPTESELPKGCWRVGPSPARLIGP